MNLTTKKKYLELIKNNPYSINNLPEEYQNDEDIALTALSYDAKFIKSMKTLRTKTDFLLKAIKKVGASILLCVPESISANPKFWLDIVKVDRSAIEYAPTEIKNNLEVVMEFVKADGMNIEFLPKEIASKPEVIFEALKNTTNALRVLPTDLKNYLDEQNCQTIEDIMLEVNKFHSNSLKAPKKEDTFGKN